MRNKMAVFAASLPLMVMAVGASGTDIRLQMPTTDRAQEMRPLLSRAGHAVHDKVATTAGDRISDLWIFPTGDDHTVFVQYTVTSKQASSKATASQVHLELLQMQGDRVVEERDLTHVGDDGELQAQQASSGLIEEKRS